MEAKFGPFRLNARAERAREEVLEKITDFVRQENALSETLKLRLARTDEEAREMGWPAKAVQEQVLAETIRNLPVDVAARIRLV